MTREQYRTSLKGRRCYVGMDLSSTKDLTSLVAVFPDSPVYYDHGIGNKPGELSAIIDRPGGFDVLAQFFVPQENMRERVNRDRVPYDQWARDGHLVATSGNIVDYEAVRLTLKGWATEFAIREIAFDPWNATDLVTRLQEQDGFVCVPIRQGMTSLAAPTKALETYILGKKLRHDGNPVLRWNVSNVSVEPDAAGNMKPSKSKSTEKIDGVVALIMAISRMDANNSTKEPEHQIFVFGGAR